MSFRRSLKYFIVFLALVFCFSFGASCRAGQALEQKTEEQEELENEIAELKQELSDKDKEISELKEESQKEIEEMQEKLQRIDSLFTSEVIQESLSVNGTVKEISDHSLIIMGFGFADFVIPISEDAKIFTEYILPEGTPEEEVWGRIYTDDREVKTGRKETNFEEIKVEDNVFIHLNLKSDYTIEGVEIEVSPQDLFDF